jgi:hypothetical protein
MLLMLMDPELHKQPELVMRMNLTQRVSYLRIWGYYDSDNEFDNMAQDLDKIVMICHSVTIQDEKINVCYDYGAAFSVLCLTLLEGVKLVLGEDKWE